VTQAIEWTLQRPLYRARCAAAAAYKVVSCTRYTRATQTSQCSAVQASQRSQSVHSTCRVYRVDATRQAQERLWASVTQAIVFVRRSCVFSSVLQTSRLPAAASQLAQCSPQCSQKFLAATSSMGLRAVWLAVVATLVGSAYAIEQKCSACQVVAVRAQPPRHPATRSGPPRRGSR